MDIRNWYRRVLQVPMIYSGDKYYFMDNVTFDQIEVGSDIIDEYQSKFLKEDHKITIQLYDNSPVSILLPDHIIFKVMEADGVVKGQTAASSYKPAVLERGIKTSVPPFIEVGDDIVINTNDSSYVEKAKK